MVHKNIFRATLVAISLVTLTVSAARAQFADQATWVQTGSGTANAQVVALPNVSALADLRGVTVRFIAGATNTGPATLAIGGTTATSVKKLTPDGLRDLTGGEILLGVPVAVLYDGTQYVLTTSPAAASPTPLTAATTFYVATTGSNTNNNCTSVASPCATIQYAWDQLVKNFDTNGQNVTIQLADGTYTAGMYVTGQPVGLKSSNIVSGVALPSSVVVKGNCTTPANVLINTVSDSILVVGAASLTLQCLAIQSGGTNVSAYWGSTVAIDRINFLSSGASGYQIAASQATVVVQGNYNILAGGGRSHIIVVQAGQVYFLGGHTITITGTPVYSEAFMRSGQGASMDVRSTTFTGAVSAVKYWVSLNGTIFVGTGNCDAYFPGSGNLVTTGGICS